MTKPHKGLIAHLRRHAARRGRGETGTRLAALFARAGQVVRNPRRRQPHARLAENEPQTKITQPSESRSAQPGGSSSRLVAAGLRLVAQSLRQAFAAHRRYHELRSKGIPHETAIRLALRIPRGAPRE